jgi:hypothetical protein
VSGNGAVLFVGDPGDSSAASVAWS